MLRVARGESIPVADASRHVAPNGVLKWAADASKRDLVGARPVEVVGQTERGRDLYAARVGTGERVLLVQGAVHGNERTGTEALLGILRKLGSGNHILRGTTG